MTSRAPAWFEQKYINGAIHVLQAKGYVLQGTTRAATSQKGNEVTWKIAGDGEATEMSDAIEDRPTLNAGRDTVKATMVDYEANEWIKTTDVEKMSENEQQVAQQTCGMALGRKFDRIILGAMDDEGGNIETIGSGTANIDLPDILEANTNIGDEGDSMEMQYFVALPVRQLGALLLRKGWSSADYVTDTPLLKKIGARRYLNMTFLPMPKKMFAVPSANQADGYMWAKDCVGFATPTDEKGLISAATRIDYVPTKKAYFAGNTMSAAARVLLVKGVKRLRVSTNTALTAGL
ncbi:phage capsid protein [Bosea sp. (in: a-proteobacteria)]|uniref:phage capsid protein n=1 Tax=Bosea sp. (in: a-proteobacteria) TaxID=1871050 RepID=UPI00261FB72E|nr:phage capsid protein [Bosea sp. (in: a-proteobacteria)]MCO5091992.1 phage capsid protein [Bosea sp. (in: a-proteobacteria)]